MSWYTYPELVPKDVQEKFAAAMPYMIDLAYALEAHGLPRPGEVATMYLGGAVDCKLTSAKPKPKVKPVTLQGCDKCWSTSNLHDMLYCPKCGTQFHIGRSA